MTCSLAVKRPHDYESYLSPDSSVEAKRSRTANTHCSPFRPQLSTLATSLMQSTSASTFLKENALSIDKSPFANISSKSKLNENQIESYLRAEIQHLKRRKLIPQKNVSLENSDDCITTANNSYRQPAASHSGSDSDGESSNLKLKNQQLFLSNLYEKPQFSLKQVKLICERLLKEQELHLRYEYETVLNKKLEEQHDQYVQFAKEQIENHKNKKNDFFYLS